MTPRQAYGGFMLLAAVVFLLARRCFPPPADVIRLPLGHRFALAGSAFIGGVLGAKLPFALQDDVWSEAAWAADGKTITTALIGAYLAVEVVKWSLRIRVSTGDGFAIPLALALGAGRWGCFFNGCCYGTTCELPWSVDFGDGLHRHPTQVYESLFHFAMAAVLIALTGRDLLRGHRLKLYLIAYAVFRFLTEFIRPEPVVFGGLTFYQWSCLALGAGLAVQWRLQESSPPLRGGGTSATSEKTHHLR